MSTPTRPTPDTPDANPKALTIPVVLLMQCFFFLTAWALNVFALRRPLQALLLGGASVGVQLLFGVVLGTVLSVSVSYFILTKPALRGARTLMRQVAGILISSVTSVFIVSLLAGVGEEILFRGTLQSWIGLWWASLVFVLAHVPHALSRPLGIGALSYLLFVFLMGLVLGSVFARFGLISAVTAHAIFDLGVLLSFRQYFHQKASER